MTATSPNGFIFYRGPSMLDGKPIIAIATGIERGSRNSKTGDIVQTFIMRDDMLPGDAVRSGDDSSICGDCPHRGWFDSAANVWRDRSCYVQHGQAPTVVWKCAQRGGYPTVAPQAAGETLAGRLVRLGTYGDPAAVPFAVWQALLAGVKAKNGYSHQWRRFPELKAFCMASCDTPEEQREAVAAGWRVFRTRLASEPIANTEIACPASAERGKVTTCDLCKACGGLTAKAKVSIAIVAHGPPNKVAAYERMRARLAA